VLEAERTGQFDLLSHTYLFVGHRPVDRIPADVKVVVARDYSPNVEHLPMFYDFTGWHVLASHELITADHAIMLQYDMWIIDSEIETKVDALLDAAPGMVAFNAGYWGPNWMLHIPGFEEAYRAGLATVGVNPDDFGPFNEWPCTQGTAWRTKTLTEFMIWFAPMFEVFKDHVFAGHLAERTVKAYLAANGIPEQYLLGAIAHEAADMHGTGALMRGDRALYEARNAEFMRGVPS
jgi:hypothetical protein